MPFHFPGVLFLWITGQPWRMGRRCLPSVSFGLGKPRAKCPGVLQSTGDDGS